MIPRPKFLQDQVVSEQYKKENNFNQVKPSTPKSFGLKNFQNTHGSNRNTQSNNIRCPFKGCRFNGPSEIVKLHNEIQHLELRNKYNMISMPCTPEDIEQWRAERKAKYPKFGNEDKKNDTTNKNVSNCNKKLNCNKSWQNDRRSNWNNRQPINNRNRYNHSKNFTKQYKVNENNVFAKNVVSRITDEPKNVERNNSLNLLSNYLSDDEPEVATTIQVNENNFHMEHDVEPICAQIINELVSNVEKETIKQHKMTNDKKAQRLNKRRPPRPPPMYYNKLTLFQKLMLQDVRNVKHSLLESLQILVDNNFFQSANN